MALALLGDPRAIPLFVEAGSHAKARAFRGLVKIGPPAVDALVQLTKTSVATPHERNGAGPDTKARELDRRSPDELQR